MSKNLVSLLLLFLIIPSVAFGQTTKDSFASILDKQIYPKDFEENNVEIIRVLMNSFYLAEIPAGVSGIFRNYTKTEFEPKLNFPLKNSTLRDILTEITNLDPRYEWKEEKGVINVFPINDYSILDKTISEFNFDNKTKEELLSKLLNTNEFQAHIKENNLIVNPFNSLDFGGLQGRRVEPKKITLNLTNATVREILNEIVRQNEKSAWIYYEYESNVPDKEITKRFYTLRFLVSKP